MGRTVTPVGKPDAGDQHVRFDERGRETERALPSTATAFVLDFTQPACSGCIREQLQSWRTLGLDPTPAARTLWLQTHPLGANKLVDVATDSLGRSGPSAEGVG